jgi:uncharacterized protein (TIGR02246 family)
MWLTRLALGALSAGVVAACSPGASVSPGVPPELKHSWEVNFNRGNAAAVAALYAPDAQLLVSGSEPVKGAAAIGEAVDSMIRSGVKLRIETTQNVGSGDLAYVYGDYAVQGGDGKEVDHGTYVEVWRHRAGDWKITIDINASSLPATPAPAPVPAPSS